MYEYCNYCMSDGKENELDANYLCDVLNDVKRDLKGVSLTLNALIEQPFVIQGEQLAMLADLTFQMHVAVGKVSKDIYGDEAAEKGAL